ncbi:MAG: class I SAM-dependent methyltransferase [Candidatus Nanoarchaeia archaeon]|nr:class I SAM-dependent methyltransferase [Candidatus Nanoarchaeia archaeon]
MTPSIQQSYQQQTEFWRKNYPKLVGDFEQRPLAVEILVNSFEDDIKDELILDAGCGTGYVSRMLAQRGADVHGVDNSNKMLAIAEEIEKANPLGINYYFGDITCLHFGSDCYEGIICTGVVPYLSPEQYGAFLNEAKRVLIENCPLVITSIHPSMFNHGSPARKRGKCWVKLSPLEDVSIDRSQIFSQQLYDINGNCFSSEIWHHPLSFLVNSLTKRNFRVEEVQEPVFREHYRRVSPSWGTEYDYPSHLIIKARKE